MKKILILVDKIGRKKELFAQLISERLEQGCQLILAKFGDLYFEIDGKNIHVSIKDTPITEFSLVYFRRAGDSYSIIAGTLAICLKKLGIKFIDSSWQELGPLGSKFTSLVKLSLAGLPVFPSIYTWPSNIKIYAGNIVRKLGYPFVAKELSMQRGKGVFLIKNRSGLDNLPLIDKRGKENHFLFQKFYELDEEYRLLVLGDKVRVWEKKVLNLPDEFRHNIALGAREEFMEIKNLPVEFEKVAVEAANTLNIEISGVDIAVEKGSRKIWLIEANRGPGLTYDTTISSEIAQLARYLKDEAKD